MRRSTFELQSSGTASAAVSTGTSTGSPLGVSSLAKVRTVFSIDSGIVGRVPNGYFGSGCEPGDPRQPGRPGNGDMVLPSFDAASIFPSGGPGLPLVGSHLQQILQQIARRTGVMAAFSIVSEIWFAAAAQDCKSAALPMAGLLWFLVCLFPSPIVFMIATVVLYTSARRIRAAHVWIALAVVACCVLSWAVFGHVVPSCNRA